MSIILAVSLKQMEFDFLFTVVEYQRTVYCRTLNIQSSYPGRLTSWEFRMNIFAIHDVLGRILAGKKTLRARTHFQRLEVNV